MSDDIRKEIGLRPVINVSGTMTSLGASIVVPEAIAAISAILPQFVEVNDLQRKASAIIARLTGGEAGFVTASCSAGISLAVAATITGNDLLAIEKLPDVSTDKNEVLVQMGHVVSYGAPVDQAIRIAGGKVVFVGQATSTHRYHMENAITDRTAAAVFVVSHHVVDYGLLNLKEFVEIAHAKDVPVIVDAASEYDLRIFLEQGADIAIYSGHKFLGGPTSGIVAGQKELVRHAFLQNMGIGRGMKAGKESIAGVMAALEAWETRDHEGVRERETSYLQLWKQALDGRRHERSSPYVRERALLPLGRRWPEGPDEGAFVLPPHQFGRMTYDRATTLALEIVVVDAAVSHGLTSSPRGERGIIRQKSSCSTRSSA